MLTSETNHLDQLLIRALTVEPGSTAKALLVSVSKGAASYTLQGVYHELQKLQVQGVVVKWKDRFSLSLLWVNEMMDLVDSMYEHYLRNFSLLDILPEEGSKRTWVFSNLLRMDDFKLQLRLEMLESIKAKNTFCWIPHLFFTLLHTERRRSLSRYIEHTQRKVHCIIGSRSPLDEYSIKMFTKEGFVFSTAKSRFYGENNHTLEVVGPYILTSKFQKPIVDAIDGLYRKYKSPAEIPHGAIQEILSMKTKVRVKLEHFPKKADQLQKYFREYFGVPKRKSS